MKRLRKWLASASVEVSEQNGVRMLHLGGDAVQSAMRLSSPDALELHYTRAMMAFLLFRPRPRELLMIGLGGGSLARYIRGKLPATRMTVIEISAKVVAAARSLFGLPPDDARLRVVVEDGAKYLPRHPGCADVLLLDGFDDGEQPRALCTPAFYDAAYAALREGGIMMANFMAEDGRFDTYLARIEASFRGRVLCLHAADRVNIIVLAFRGGESRVAWATLKKRARELAREHALPFERFIAGLREMNPHSAGTLRLMHRSVDNERW